MSDQEIQKKFPYNFTAVPNIYLDEWLRTLGNKANAKLVMIYIYRKTLGWRGRPIEATITLDEFREFLGIDSYSTIEAAIKVLVDHGFIEVRQEGGSKKAKIYRLTAKTFLSTKSVDTSTEIEDTRPRITDIIPDEPTESVDTNLQKLEIGIYENRRNPSTEPVETELRQPFQGEAPPEPKETLKERFKEKEKERQPQASPSAAASPNGSPRVSISKTKKENTEDKHEPTMTTGEQAPLQAEERNESNTTPGQGNDGPAPARTAELVEADKRRLQREQLEKQLSETVILIGSLERYSSQWLLAHKKRRALEAELEQLRNQGNHE